MEDIVNILGYFSLSTEGIAALASVVFYSKYKHSALKYLPFLLVYMFILELFGYIMIKSFDPVDNPFMEYNNFFYNLFNVAFFSYFYYVFYHFLKSISNKKVVLLVATLYGLSVIYDLWVYNVVEESLRISYILGGCCIIICVVLYFLEMLNSSRVLSIRQDLLFWMGVGLLLFYVGYIPIKIIRLTLEPKLDIFMFLRIIHLILIVVLYGCFTAGLVWKKRN